MDVLENSYRVAAARISRRQNEFFSNVVDCYLPLSQLSSSSSSSCEQPTEPAKPNMTAPAQSCEPVFQPFRYCMPIGANARS